jgi:hypothetical protein
MNATREGEILSTVFRQIEFTIRALLQKFQTSSDSAVSDHCELAAVFQGAVRSVIRHAKTMHDTLDQWKRAIFRGDKEYDQQTEESVKRAVQDWLSAATFLMDEATAASQRGASLAHPRVLLRLRPSMKEFKRVLEDWTSPTLAKSVSSRRRKLTREQAEAMQGSPALT